MSVYMTIDGVTTSLTYNTITNAIKLDSMQFSEDTQASTQIITATKPISTATPQLYALAKSQAEKKVTIYVFDDETQDSFIVESMNGSIQSWMISLEPPGSQKEYLTIGAAQVNLKS
jgi:hypothetical protein